MRVDDLDELRLDGRTALITGGARGLGRAIAELIGHRGAAVLLFDLDGDAAKATASELASDGVDVMPMQGDVSRPEDADRAVSACVERWGRIDILVNNAGISGRQVPIWEIENEDWKRVLAVNLDSVFFFCKAAVPHMIEKRYGRIVNMASMAGKEGNANNGQYSTSKAGVIGLTKSLGKELATRGVLVNAVAPAVIETDIIRGEGIDPKVRDFLISKIPMGRMGQPIELARLVGFLVSDHLTFSTGFVYDLSGGRATY
jgi:3-oxoacyl-[acyl-carrier protein] reductase